MILFHDAHVIGLLLTLVGDVVMIYAMRLLWIWLCCCQQAIIGFYVGCIQLDTMQRHISLGTIGFGSDTYSCGNSLQLVLW